jgi:hypothetical protein
METYWSKINYFRIVVSALTIVDGKLLGSGLSTILTFELEKIV